MFVSLVCESISTPFVCVLVFVLGFRVVFNIFFQFIAPMHVLSAREHAATEAHARGGVDVPGRSPTGSANTDCEAHAPVLTSEWAARFMHGFNNPDSVRASSLPRTGSSPLSYVRGPVPYGQNSRVSSSRASIEFYVPA